MSRKLLVVLGMLNKHWGAFQSYSRQAARGRNISVFCGPAQVTGAGEAAWVWGRWEPVHSAHLQGLWVDAFRSLSLLLPGLICVFVCLFFLQLKSEIQLFKMCV